MEQRQMSPRLDPNGDAGCATQRLCRNRLRQGDDLVVGRREDEHRRFDVRQSSRAAERGKTAARQAVFTKEPFRDLEEKDAG
jgi:hypothetical protein